MRFRLSAGSGSSRVAICYTNVLSDVTVFLGNHYQILRFWVSKQTQVLHFPEWTTIVLLCFSVISISTVWEGVWTTAKSVPLIEYTHSVTQVAEGITRIMNCLTHRNSHSFQTGNTYYWNAIRWVHMILHRREKKRTLLQLSKRHFRPSVHHHIPFLVLLWNGCRPFSEPCHTHMDSIDGFSSVDHDELLAQLALVLVPCNDDVVYASPPNHNRNRLIGNSRNGCSGEDEIVLWVRVSRIVNSRPCIP